MGRYTKYQRQQEGPVNRGQVHPIMRGIGCVLLAIVPLISYVSGVLLVKYGLTKGWPIPPEWLGNPDVHPLLWKLQGLRPVWAYYQSQANLMANIIFAIAIAIVIFGVISTVYGFLYKYLGPPQYGPNDAPPIRVKVKRYKR